MGWGVLQRPRLNADRITIALHAAESDEHRREFSSMRCPECSRRAAIVMGVVEDSSTSIDKWDWR